MAYKSILAVLSDPEIDGPLLTHASRLTHAEAGHLTALCLGIDPLQRGYYYTGGSAHLESDSQVRAQADADRIETFARDALETSAISWSCKQAIAPFSGIGNGIERDARFSDLVIVPPPYQDSRDEEAEMLLDAVLFDGQAQVLIMPKAVSRTGPPKRAVIAWNESVEALHAVRAAMPVLELVDEVSITTIETRSSAPQDSGVPLLRKLLMRHGITSSVDVLPRRGARIADVLLDHTTAYGGDLLVMGAYGHSRFREALLGGPTHDILEITTVPVLMSH